MADRIKIGFAVMGEVNTPYEKLQEKHDGALSTLIGLDIDVTDAGIVIDDPAYKTADAAVDILKATDMDALVICVAGWIPTHAAIRVTDEFRHLPMLLWGLCGWMENGRIVTTAEQAGTTALRPTFEAMGYRFKFVYNVIGHDQPTGEIMDYLAAAHAARQLRHARLGTMGYRDMLLYGTQYEGLSLRRDIGVEVEPMEMLEMVQTAELLHEDDIERGIRYVRDNWTFLGECGDDIIRRGVVYALSLGKKISERGWSAVTLIDVDGMKKLLSFPPAMVFMLIDEWYGVATVPENDVMGGVTQLMCRLLTGDPAPYLEYYEFFDDSVLIGVPDYVPASVTDGGVKVLPAAFGLLSSSLLNVSKLRTGRVTCVRLIYNTGSGYILHLYTGTAQTPPAWNEYGWDEPAPQLPSLKVVLDSPMADFAQKVSSQHVIVTYGDNTARIRDLCAILGIEII